MIRRQDLKLSDFRGSSFVSSEEFVKTYPKMDTLLKKAKIVEFKINNVFNFRQYIWTLSDGTTAGWVCRIDHCVPRGRNIIHEHELLANHLGGIIESWIDKAYDKNDDTLIKNNTFTFCLSDSMMGIGEWADIYLETCKSQAVKPFDTNDFVTFALELNGNITFYHKDSKQVYLYLPDGYKSLDVELVKGQPEYTIHQLSKARSFTDYVELIAIQWLDITK